MKDVINALFWILVLLLMVFLLVNIATEIIMNIKVINKIKEPENCIIMDSDIYCKKEL